MNRYHTGPREGDDEREVIFMPDTNTAAQPKLRNRLDEYGMSVGVPALEMTAEDERPKLSGASEDFMRWNPMVEDFRSAAFNSYDRGPGRDLPPDRRGRGASKAIDAPGVEPIQMYVTGIPNELTEEGLKNLFVEAGDVLRVKKCRSNKPDADDTFGFVTFGTVREAEMAIRKFDGFSLGGGHFRLKVKFALTEEEKAKRAAERQENRNFMKGIRSRGDDDSDTDIPVLDHARKTARERGIEADFSTKADAPSTFDGQGTAPQTRSAGQPTVPVGRAAYQYQATGIAEPVVGASKQKLQKVLNENSVDLGYSSGHNNSRPESPNDRRPIGRGATYGGDSRVGKPDRMNQRYRKPAPEDKIPDKAFPSNPCHVCGKLGNSRCQKCKTPYCSKGCQAKDWPEHRKICQETSQFESDFLDQFDVHVGSDLLGSVAEMVGMDRRDLIPKKGSRFMVANIPKETLPQGTFSVAVTHYKGPSDFWVIVQREDASNTKLLLEQEEALTKAYMHTKNIGHQSYVPEEGELCVGQSRHDKSWYRVKVDKILLDGTVTVTCVDFGYSEDLPVTALRKIKKEFVELPMQGIHCSLAGVVPATANLQWSNAAVELCHERLSDEGRKLLSAEYVKTVKEKVYLNIMSRDESLSEILIKRGHAKKSESVQEKRVDLHTQSAANLPTGLPPPPGQPTITKYMSKGMKITVNIMEVESPALFWIQRLDEPSLQELPALTDAMNRHYEQLPPKQGFRPLAKKLYAAKYKADQQWYRAQAVDFNTSSADMLFLDYGNGESVPFPFIHSLESTHCSLPFQAVPCGLENSVLDKTYTDQETAKFKDMLLQCSPDAVFKAKVVSKTAEGYVQVELINPATGGIIGTESSQDKQPTITEDMGKLSLQEESALGYNKGSQQHLGATRSQTRQNTHPYTESSRNRIEVLKRTSLPSVDLPKDNVISVLVSEASELTGFYVQAVLPEIVDQVNELDELLKNYVQKPQPGALEIGQLICSKYFKDSAWYRAEVIEVMGNSKFRVNFIDYGNNEVVFHKEIGQFDERMMIYPPLAVKCSLADIQQSSRPWNASRLDNKQFIMKLVGRQGLLHMVELFDPQTGERINDELVEEGFATLTCPVDPAKQEDCSDSQQTVSDRRDAEPERSRQVLAPPPPCQVKDFPVMDIAEGKQCAAVVTSAEAYDQIWIQLGQQEYIHQLSELTEYLAKLCTGRQEFYTPQVGEVVCARFSEDQSWYRAAVCEQQQSDKYKVTFIDFGNQDIVRKCDIQKCTPDLMKYPVLALKCVIPDVQKGKREWDPNFLSGRLFQVTLMKKIGDIYSVDLVDNDTGRSMRDELIEKQYVSLSEPSLHVQQLATSRNTRNQREETYRGGYQENQKVSQISQNQSRDHSDQRQDQYDHNQNRDQYHQSRDRYDHNQIREQPIRNQSRDQYHQSQYQHDQSREQPVQNQNRDHFNQRRDQSRMQLAQQQGMGAEMQSQNRENVRPGVVMYNDIPTQSVNDREVDMLCVYVVNPNEMYFQLIQQDTLTQFCKILSALNSNCNQVRAPYVPKPDEMVAACSAADQTWYRARVLNNTSSTKAMVEVCFTDFGNKEKLSFASLQKLDPAHASLPHQGITCSMADVTEQCPDFKAEDFLQKQFRVQIVGKEGTKHFVELHDPDDGTNINKKLAESEKLIEIAAQTTPDKCQVLVCHAVSPDKFYVNLIQETIIKQFVQLNADMLSAYSQQKGQHVARVGETVAAFYAADGSWCRGKVLNVQKKAYTIQYIDFGNIEEVPQEKVQKLQTQFTQIPAQAVVCGLATAAGTVGGGEWTAQAVATFKQICIDQQFMMQVLDRIGDKVYVELRGEDKTVGEQLVEMKLAVPSKHKSDKQSSSIDDRMRSSYQGENQLHQRSPEEDKSCQRLEVVPQGSRSRSDDGRRPLSSGPSAGMLFVEDLPIRRLPLAFPAVVYEVRDPSEFYCQHASKEVLLSLSNLMSRLATYCDSTPTSRDFKPEQGQLVASRFAQDGVWYRAIVTGPQEAGRFEVQYMDYGNTEMVSPEDMLPLTKSFLELPAQSIRCALAAVEPRHGPRWESTVAQAFKGQLLQNAVLINIVQQLNNAAVVTVELPSPAGPVDIAQWLINHGHALAQPRAFIR